MLQTIAIEMSSSDQLNNKKQVRFLEPDPFKLLKFQNIKDRNMNLIKFELSMATKQNLYFVNIRHSESCH